VKLVIAEKPSVAKSLAYVMGVKKKRDGYYEGEKYLVSWCLGHLIRMASPEGYNERYARWKIEDLPIFPDEFIYEVSPKTKKQFYVLKKLMADKRVDSIINACDAGREGELIFRLVYDKAKCRKKIERLWISSMEDQAIRAGFQNLKDGKAFENLYDSALARSMADWLVGMNLSRLYSCLYKQPYSVGRVQTPTLNMITERDVAIENFVKENYYTVEIGCEGLTLSSDRIDDYSVAEQLRNLIDRKIRLSDVISKKKVIAPDKPYDLTTLQREANKKYGYSAQKSLDLAQRLYEKKLITYPRTDSRYLTDDMKRSIKSLLENLSPGFTVYEKSFGSIFNSSKVSDHYAIIPTLLQNKEPLEKLSSDEKKIYQLIKAKLLMACAEPLVESMTKVIYHYDGFDFTAQAKRVIDPGFTVFSIGKKEQKEKILPPLQAEDVLEVLDVLIKEKYTKPPSHFTEDTLLKAMEVAGNDALQKGVDVERKGLGTPATRAGIIENLIHKGFVERDKKNLLVTHKGINLVTIVENTFKSAKTTAEWEMKLSDIANGKAGKEDFLREIENEITKTIVKYR